MKVLVVDDDLQTRRGIVRYLRARGLRAEDVCDGRAAIERLDAEPFDVVLTDLNMPDMDGIELIIALRDSGLPVIAMSGGGLSDKELLLDSASGLGAVRAVPKPVDLERLVVTISEFTDG